MDLPFDEGVLRSPEDVLEVSLGGFPGARMGVKRECMALFREGVRRWPEYDWRIVLEQCPDAMLISGGVEYLDLESQQRFVNAATKVNFAKRDMLQTPPDDSRLNSCVVFDRALASPVGYIVANLARDVINQEQLLQVLKDFPFSNRLCRLYGERAKSIEEIQLLEPSGLVFSALESFKGDWKPEDLVFAIRYAEGFISRMKLRDEHVSGWERVLKSVEKVTGFSWHPWRYKLRIRLEAYKLKNGASGAPDIRVVHQVDANRGDLALVYLSRFKKGVAYDNETACFLWALASDLKGCWLEGALEAVESYGGRPEFYGFLLSLKGEDVPDELLRLKERVISESALSLGEQEAQAKAFEALNLRRDFIQPRAWFSKSKEEIRSRIEYLTGNIDGREFWELLCLMDKVPDTPKEVSFEGYAVQNAKFWLCYEEFHDQVVESAKAFLAREDAIRCAKENLHTGHIYLADLAVRLVQDYEPEFEAGPWSFAVLAQGGRARYDLEQAEQFWLGVPVQEIGRVNCWCYMVQHSKKLRQHFVDSLEDLRIFPVHMAECVLRRCDDECTSQLESFLKEKLLEGKLGPSVGKEYLDVLASTRRGQWLYENGLWDELDERQISRFLVRPPGGLSLEAVLAWIDRVDLDWHENISLAYRPDVLWELKELGRNDILTSIGKDKFFIYPLMSSKGHELWERLGLEFMGCDEPVVESWCDEL